MNNEKSIFIDGKDFKVSYADILNTYGNNVTAVGWACLLYDVVHKRPESELLK